MKPVTKKAADTLSGLLPKAKYRNRPGDLIQRILGKSPEPTEGHMDKVCALCKTLDLGEPKQNLVASFKVGARNAAAPNKVISNENSRKSNFLSAESW
ncbi:hypothetical protein [Ruegeria halocynthiae]|uniref:hypothetical protein n=1 Tax=Ruegeria halocynthiae TaxID=985054 RepID=UPI0013627508|nr:hypothetical protein [Ruegeria halocynthiae]